MVHHQFPESQIDIFRGFVLSYKQSKEIQFTMTKSREKLLMLAFEKLESTNTLAFLFDEQKRVMNN